MNLDILQLLADSGVALLVTVVLLYWNRMDAKDRLEEMRQQLERERQNNEQQLERERALAEQERVDKKILIDALHNNTMVLTELVVLLKRRNGSA